jgi:Right handed beta helix region
MKNPTITCFAMSALLAGLVPCSGADNIASPSAQVVVGDPTKAAELPTAILNAYAAGARDITITPGTYRIPPTGKCAIPLEQWKDTTIHAKGVTLIFEELAQRPIYLNRCENVTWEGGTLRFAEPSFTQGRVKAMGTDAEGTYLDWQIDAGYPIFDPAKSTFDAVDQKTRLLKTGTGDIGCKSVETLGAGLYRIRGIYGGLGPTAVNDWIFTRRPDGGSSIIHLDGCSHCTMRGITLQNSGFAAFFETGGSGGHHYLDCRIAPGPKPAGASEEQLVGCGADGFHSSGVRIGPTFERCVWEGVLHDDCIAIHGSLQKISRADGNKLILEKGNRGGFVAGEPVRVSSADGFFAEFTCTALRVLKDEGELLELTLDRVSGVPAEAKASNPRNNGAGYKILNCTMGNCRSRGILVKSDNGLIEGCTISGCGMSAISIGPEYYWSEADYSKNVTIRGNTLRNNVLNGSEAGGIFVHGDGAMGNSNLTITGNLFDKNYGQIAIHAEDTDGILIADNRFIASPIPLPNGIRTILNFESSKNIVLKGNAVEGSPEGDTLVKLGKDVVGVSGNETTGINRVR